MAYWLIRMAGVRRRINHDPNRKAYFDLALQEGKAEEMDELTLFQATRGGVQAVAKRRAEDAARDHARAGRAAGIHI